MIILAKDVQSEKIWLNWAINEGPAGSPGLPKTPLLF